MRYPGNAGDMNIKQADPRRAVRILAVTGHYGSGKDTFAEYALAYLTEKKLAKAKIFHFADVLKAMARKHFDWDGNKRADWVTFFDGLPNPTTFLGGRKLLQGIGNLLREEVGFDVFIKKLETEITEAKLDVAIIPDLRFVNEAKWVQSYYNCVVKVKRDGYNGDDDRSETEMDSSEFLPYVTHVVQNNRALHDLKGQAEEIAFALTQ